MKTDLTKTSLGKMEKILLNNKMASLAIYHYPVTYRMVSNSCQQISSQFMGM